MATTKQPSKKKAVITAVAAAVLLIAGAGYSYKLHSSTVAPTPTLPIAVTTPIATESATPISTIAATPSTCLVSLADPANPQSVLPDSKCTPGATNPEVTQATISTTICKTGWTTTYREQEPTSYYEDLKVEQIKAYGFTNTNTKDYEEDHFIPLELGGANAQANLWPEYDAGKIPNEKDKVEDYLQKQVCDGNIPLAQARTEITTNWYIIYQAIK